MIGLRSPSFYQKLDRTPNIKLIDYRTPNEVVLKGADVILSINGTSIAEAAFLRKPAIQVGDLGTTQKLPNVSRHTDMTTLAAKIKAVLEKPSTDHEYERRLENFVAAAYDTGFDSHYIFEWGTPKEDPDIVWQLYLAEIQRVFAQQTPSQ